jgi:ABC-type transporter Mla subunit MlaD
MRLPIPGPSAVLGGAAAAADAIETALGLVPRAAAAMDRVEALLDRVDGVVDRAEQVVTRADETTARTHAILSTAEIVTRDAGRAVDGATGVLDRVDRTLTTWEAPLRTLAPAAQRFADGLDEAEVTAAITLVDRMPTLLDHVENDVLPMLQNLDRVGPDLHEVLEVVQDLRRVVTGLPGIGLLRRRGEEEPPPVEGSLHDD